MNLNLTESLVIAHMILKKIKVPKKAEALVLGAQGYENGREHGLCIGVMTKQGVASICWSENRNSDEIVVYAGIPGEMFTAGNVPTERAFLAARYFRFSEHEKAARYIESCMVEYL